MTCTPNNSLTLTRRAAP